jgi:hypothetical protein
LIETLVADASFLDHWSFDQFQGLLNRSFDDIKLRQLLLQDKLVIFLHLLGCDTNGHAHRPYSSIYLNNVKVVDQIAESMYNLMGNYFKDNQTAYVFTADHGMSDKGKYTKICVTNILLLIFIYFRVRFHSILVPGQVSEGRREPASFVVLGEQDTLVTTRKL